MNSLPNELYEQISKHIIQYTDKISLKKVSKIFNSAVKKISIQISLFETLYNKPKIELKFCANAECGPFDWKPVGVNYKLEIFYKNQKKIYYPYCYKCCHKIYNRTPSTTSTCMILGLEYDSHETSDRLQSGRIGW